MGYKEQFILSMAFTGITTLLLGFFVLSRNIKNKIYVIFSLYSFSIAWWSLAQIGTVYGPDLESSWFWSRFEHIGVAFIPTFFLHFVILFLDLKSKKRLLLLSYILSLLFVLAIPIRLLVAHVSRKLGGIIFYGNPGPFYTPLVIFFIICVSYCLWELFIAYKVSSGARRNQLKYLWWSSLCGYVGGAANFFLIYDKSIPILNPYGTYLVGIYALVFAYAILKFRLLDINIALTRAGIFAVVYALVLGLPFVVIKWLKPVLIPLLGENWWIAILVFGMALASAGPFIYLYLQRRAEKILRKEQLAYQKDLRDISSTMMLIKELEKLLRTIVLRVVDIVKVSWAGIYLKEEKEQKFTLRHQRAKPSVRVELPQEFSPDSSLVKHLHQEKLPTIGEEIRSSELKVGLAVPCFIEDNLLGFLLLGDKPKRQIYDQSDINVFTLLSNQTALAIENCQFYSREKQLAYFNKIASLDHQIDCMAHEIDNPNAAILAGLGSIEMSLDEIKEKIPQDKLEYIKHRLSRTTFSCKRISRMINSVKEFSKPSTGEIKAITLREILESFGDILEFQVKHYGIDFIQQTPQESIWLRANKTEIEQVLVNLGTNSVQAIREVATSQTKPEQWEKQITLKAYKKDDFTLRMDFSDTGSGIEEKLLEDIFLDFVTTKASSVGTGLGLSISRKIITRHKGRLWAESEGEGRNRLSQFSSVMLN